MITYLLLGLGMAWAIDLIGRLFQINSGLPVPSILVALGGSLGVNWIIAAILALVVQPIADTLVFQGILYPVLARDLRHNLWAIMATAVIYAIVNLALSSGVNVTVWYILIQPFLMALVVTAVRAYTQSLWPTFATRAMFGLFFLFSALILKV